MNQDHTHLVLKQAFEYANLQNLPIVLASTTGETADEMLRIMGDKNARLVVVSHDRRQLPKEWQFRPEIAARLTKRKILFLRNYPIVPISIRLLRRLADIFGILTVNRRDQFLEETFGTAGRVCFQIVRLALKENAVREGERIVAVAGEKSGASASLLLQIVSSRPVRILLLEVIANSVLKRQV